MSGRFAQGGVVAMPKTYVQPVGGARYRWLASVKFCECRFESGRASALIVATRQCPVAQSYDAGVEVRRRKVLEGGTVLACQPMIVGLRISSRPISCRSSARARSATPLTMAAPSSDGSKWIRNGRLPDGVSITL